MAKAQTGRRYQTAKARAENSDQYENTVYTIPEGVSEFRIKDEGSYNLDIMPYEVGGFNKHADAGTLFYELTYFIHRGVGADENRYVCPRKMGVGKCPICEHRAALSRIASTPDQVLKDLAPKNRQLFNVIDLDNEDLGIQIWESSFHLFGKALDKKIKNGQGDYDLFFSADEGYSIRALFEEEKLPGTKYMDCKDIEFRTRASQYEDDVVDQTHVLDDLLIIKPYEELADLFHETAAEPVSGKSAAQGAPKKTVAKKTVAKKPAATKPEPEQEPEPEQPNGKAVYYRTLGESADGGEQEAINELDTDSRALGLDPDEFATWAAVGEALAEAAEAEAAAQPEEAVVEKPQPTKKPAAKKPAAKKSATKKPAPSQPTKKAAKPAAEEPAAEEEAGGGDDDGWDDWD